MKVFFVGDFASNTGPAMVNKLLIKALKNEDIRYAKTKSKITRVIELIYKIIFSDCVCFCSYSELNFIGLRVAKIFGKKSFYIMHGYSTYETQINNEFVSEEEIKKINNKERKIFRSVDKVFCVSEKFMKFMKQNEPLFKEKFDYNNNPIELRKIENQTIKHDKAKYNNQIVSIGGGMKRKNNLSICKAIDKLNRDKGLNLKFVVIGLPHTDKEQICSYDFVTYYDKLSHEDVLKILAESYLYIQNSIFETFGLAIIEALACNCNLLVSNSVGSTGVLKTIRSSDLIYDTSNIDEIAEKIENILVRENATRLKKGIIKEEVEYKEVASLLMGKISKYAGEE